MSQLKAQHFERDCTDKCKSKQHAKQLCSVITKRCVTDLDLCAYLNWKCSACGQVYDATGRTALHFAASCGRRRLVDWLVRCKGAHINLRDLESGYTPLHRSVFYGKINTAVTLIRLGANVSLTDYNELTPLDHAMKDRLSRVEYTASTPCQVYVWGTNANYTLGTGSQYSRQLPELLDAFHKRNTDVYIKQVCLRKFHTVLVSLDGHVFSCGYGHGGRLGLNTESTVIAPQEIKLGAFVSEASIGRDHSVFLSDSGQVWTCGLNTFHVLGMKSSPPQSLVPKALPEFQLPIKGVCTGRFHSVAWGPTAVYTWGLHAGQLGHDRSSNQTFIVPKLVTNFWGHDTKIVSVTASDGATVVLTDRGDIYALHEYQCRKIASRKPNIKKIVVVGGHLNSKLSAGVLVEKGGNELRVLVLTSTGWLFLWRETWPQLTRCIFNLTRPLTIKDAFLNCSEVLFVTNDGEAFHGEFKTKKKKMPEVTEKTQKSAFTEFIEKDDCQMVKVAKFPHIHRATCIQSDLKGKNFAVLQTDPRFPLIDVPQISSSTISDDMLNLLNESDEMDAMHDVIFKVGQKIFPVHRYIIAMQSETLNSLIEKNTDDIIEIKDVHPLLFQQLLLYIYTGKSELTVVGECPSDLRKICNDEKNRSIQISDFERGMTKIEDLNISAFEYYNKKRSRNKNRENEIRNDRDPVRLFQEVAKKFGVITLYKILDNYVYDNGFIQSKMNKKERVNTIEFDRMMHKEMYDVYIKAKSGAEIPAHKCILAGRLEYFNNLFAVRWNENTTRTVISLPVAQVTLQHIIDFLYTDKSPVECSDDMDHICDILVIADELFIDRLREMCEVALSALLTLRNAAQVLQFSGTYNASQLKRCAMEFICLNLSSVLESRTLDALDPDILDELTDFYCDWNPGLCKRVITPFSDAPPDQEVKSVAELCPVPHKFDANDDEFDKKLCKTGAKRKLRTRRVSGSESARNKPKAESTKGPLTGEDNLTAVSVVKSSEECKPDEKWVKILTEKEKHQKIVQARLRAIATAKEELENGDRQATESFTRLSSSPKAAGAPLLPPAQPEPQSTVPSPSVYQIPINVAQKMSQKQRKKLAQLPHGEQLNLVNQKQRGSDTCEPAAAGLGSSPGTAWGGASPWQGAQAAGTTPPQSFLDIVASERKQRGSWSRMRAKDLVYTQMEDRAMEELLRLYGWAEAADEVVSVQRVERGVFAAPRWVHK